MKVKVKTTGQILEVKEVKLENDYILPASRVEIINEIDWEQRRFELVKAAMQGYISNEGREYMHTESSMKNTAELCLKFADAVLAEYRKGGEK